MRDIPTLECTLPGCYRIEYTRCECGRPLHYARSNQPGQQVHHHRGGNE